jgi:hypothetical protein
MFPLRQGSLIFGTMLASFLSNSVQATDYLCRNDQASAIPAGLSSETPLVKFTQVAVANDLKRYQIVKQQNGVLFRSMGDHPSLVGLTRKNTSIQYGSTSILPAQDEIKLPPGTLTYWNNSSSEQTLPQLTGRNPVNIQNENIDSALLAFGPGRDITSHTINTPDSKVQLQTSIKPPVAGPAKPF